MNSQPVVFSGIQPSGVIHLGNYLGAIRNWLSLQKTNQCLFCVVDLHAITSSAYHPSELVHNTVNVVAAYLACGIDANQSVIFNQSSVHGHAELCWLFSCLTPLGWLNRMTQFKEKSGVNKLNASLGLYSYPVLMAADILLYKTDLVPVGGDQKQHLELTREIAQTFNRHYNNQYFTIPEPLIFEKVARIMSLRDGNKKMSKSDSSDYSRINLNDDDDTIVKKIKKSTTDSIIGFDFNTLSERTEVYNLVSIYAALVEKTLERVCDEIATYTMSHFKKQLSDLLIANIAPVRQKMNYLLGDTAYVFEVLKTGNEKAQAISEKNITEIKDIIGFFA